MTTMMRGTHGDDRWDVDTPEGLASAVEWMERHVATLGDNYHWIVPRTGSIVVIVHSTKQAIRVLGVAPETGTRNTTAPNHHLVARTPTPQKLVRL